MYAGASAIPSILFHSILSACSQINGIDHSPFSVTDTTTGMSKNGAINGITTIQPTQTAHDDRGYGATTEGGIFSTRIRIKR